MVPISLVATSAIWRARCCLSSGSSCLKGFFQFTFKPRLSDPDRKVEIKKLLIEILAASDQYPLHHKGLPWSSRLTPGYWSETWWRRSVLASAFALCKKRLRAWGLDSSLVKNACLIILFQDLLHLRSRKRLYLFTAYSFLVWIWSRTVPDLGDDHPVMDLNCSTNGAMCAHFSL